MVAELGRGVPEPLRDRRHRRGPHPLPGGLGLVRASNTNPYLTLRFEGRTADAVANMQRMVYDALRRFPYVTLPA